MTDLVDNILREIQETAVEHKDDATTHHEGLIASIQGSTLSVEDIGTKVKDAAEIEAANIVTQEKEASAKARAQSEADLANRNILEKTFNALRGGFDDLKGSIKSDFSMLMLPLQALQAMPGMKTIISLLKIVGMWLAKLFLHLVTKRLFSGLRATDKVTGSLDVKETVDNFKKWGKSLVFGRKADTPDRLLPKEDRAAKAKTKIPQKKKSQAPQAPQARDSKGKFVKDKPIAQDDAVPKWNLLQRWRARQMRKRSGDQMRNALLLNAATKKGNAASFVERMAMKRMQISQLITAKGFMAHAKRMAIANGLFAVGSIALVGTIIMFSIKAIALGAIFLLIGLAILALIAVAIWGAMYLYEKSTIFRALVDAVAGWFMAIVSSIWNIFSGFYEFFAGLFTGDFDRMFGGLKGIFGGLWDIIMAPFRAISSFIKDVFGIDIGKWLTDKLKEWLPNWALKLLGMGGDSTGMSSDILPDKPTEEAVVWDTRKKNITGDRLEEAEATAADTNAALLHGGQPGGNIVNAPVTNISNENRTQYTVVSPDPTDTFAGNMALAQ